MIDKNSDDLLMSDSESLECGGLTPLLNFAERRGNVKKNDFVVKQSAVKPAHSKVRPERLTKENNKDKR